METIKVRVTATITKEFDIEIPDDITPFEDKEEYAINEAHTMFSPLNDGHEEQYTEDSEIIKE